MKKNSHLSSLRSPFPEGFTLIELLLVIAITAILAASSIPAGSAYLTRNHLRNKTNEVVSSLSTAKLNSLSGKEGSRWGVNIAAGDITVYKGDSYLARDAVFDQSYDIPNSITITQLERSFDRLTGNPDSIATIEITSNGGDTNTVTLNEVGAIDVN